MRAPGRSRRERKPGEGSETGQSLLEFSLTLPFLIALLVGLVLFAWVGFTYVSITSAARMGARHAIGYPREPEDPIRFGNDIDAEITYMVTTAMPMLDWRQAQVIIEPAPALRYPDVRVAVRVIYPLNNPTITIPFIVRDGSFTLLPNLTLVAVSTMRID